MKQLYRDSAYMKCRPYLEEAYKSAYSELLPKNGPISVIGMSGGADSTLLFHFLLLYYKERSWDLQKIHLAYVDHGWRAESKEESREIHKKALHFGVSFHNLEIEQGKDGEGNREERARIGRYQLLLGCCIAVDARVLLIGHQKNDQVEGVLKRIFEGASFQSFSGMERCRLLSPDAQVWISRPLLPLARKEIEFWLTKRDISFFTDPTNSSYEFTRARIRHGILPILSEYFRKNLEDPLIQIAERAGSLSLFISSFYPLLFDLLLAADKKFFFLSMQSDIHSSFIQFASNPFIVKETLQLFKKKSEILAKMSTSQIQGIAEAFIGDNSCSKDERIFEVALGTVIARKGFICAFPYHMQKKISVEKTLENGEKWDWNSFVECRWKYTEKAKNENSNNNYCVWTELFIHKVVEWVLPIEEENSIVVSSLSDSRRKRGGYLLNCPFSSLRSFFPSFWDKESGRLLYSPLCRLPTDIKSCISGRKGSRYVQFKIVLR